MVHWWNVTDRGRPEVLGETLSQCYIVHHKSHMGWPVIEPGSPRWNVKFEVHLKIQLVPHSKHYVFVIKKLSVNAA